MKLASSRFSSVVHLAFLASVVSGCSFNMSSGGTGGAGPSCSVSEDEDAATITCNDGSEIVVPLKDECSVSTEDGTTRITCPGGTSAEIPGGADGAPTLVNTTVLDTGEECDFGGIRIDSGVDRDRDGSLDEGEVDSTESVCNGASRTAVLSAVSYEPPGSHCVAGGVRIDSGEDADGNSRLDDSETASTSYVCNGESGDPSSSPLTEVSAETIGAECASGGVRIDLGTDLDSSGHLDAQEITGTQYVCNGVAGIDGTNGTDGANAINSDAGAPPMATRMSILSEPAGDNCSSGGVRIDSGLDFDADGLLDAGEVSSSAYACNGEPAPTAGSAPVVNVLASDPNTGVYSTAPETVTVLEASITVPGSGTIVAIGSADAFCAAPGYGLGYDCAASGPTSGILTVADDPTAPARSGNMAFFWLAPNTTASVTRSATFEVPSAGEYHYYLRGVARAGQIGFWRGALTLLFVPHPTTADAAP
jgi:hypothetical protein